MYFVCEYIMRCVRETSMGVVLCSLLGLTSAAHSLTGKSLLIRKCCPEDQQLSSQSQLRECVPYRGPSRNDSNGPWWLDSEVPLVRSTSQQNSNHFMLGPDSAKYIEYGGMQPCDFSMTDAIDSDSDYYDLYDNGTLEYFPDAPNYHKNVSFGPESYCADRVEKSRTVATFVFLLCPCSRLPCIRKCCGSGKMLSIANNRRAVKPECVASDTEWRPEFHSDSLHRLDEVTYAMLRDLPVCGADRKLTVLNPEPRPRALDFWLFSNGSALVEDFGNGVPFAPEHYCADQSLLEDGSRVRNVVLCNVLSSTPDADGQFYGSLFIIGAVLFLATLLVHYLLPDIRANAYSKSLMAHSTSFLMSSVALAVARLWLHVPLGACCALGFVIQWSFLAAFFWLNVMCIEISWAFSGIRALQGSAKERDRKKFFYYSLYAWGSPTFISLVTALMEFVDDIPDYFIKPSFGVKTCWFSERKATLAYFYGPMAALLFTNLILFVFTAAKIIIVRRETAFLHENSHQDTQKFILYGKLFLLMGVTWITEIISWAYISTSFFWYVTDAINLLRAVFIFVVFCCKPKVLELLRQRMRELFPCCCSPSLSGSVKTVDSRKISNITVKTDISMTQINSDKSSARRSSSTSK